MLLSNRQSILSISELLLVLDQNPPYKCLLDNVRLLFLEKKIHPLQLLVPVRLLNLRFRGGLNFLDFSPKLT